MRQTTKKTQQEMVGFIVIVILVMIIGAIFLGIFLRKSQNIEVIDAEISNFLSASLGYTVDCSKEYEPDTLKRVIEMCYGKENCRNEINSCDLLNSTYSGMIQRFMPAGSISYYRMGFYHQIAINDSSTRREIMKFVSGNSNFCPSKSGGRQIFSSSSGGYVVAELEICTSKES